MSESPENQKKSSTVRAVYIFLALTMLVVFLSWRGCWYGTPMSDASIEKELASSTDLKELHRALSQITNRLAEHDESAEKFIPGVINAARHKDDVIRRTAAWALGEARKKPEVIPPLIVLLGDDNVLVRGQAAIALANHNRGDGRPQLLELLTDLPVLSPADGTVEQVLRSGEPVRIGIRVAQVKSKDGKTFEVTAPIDGRVLKRKSASSKTVKVGDSILEISPSAVQLDNALAALDLVGQKDDIPSIRRLLESNTDLTAETRRRAEAVAKHIAEKK